MSAQTSAGAGSASAGRRTAFGAQPVAAAGVPLDDVDRAILRALEADGRMSNKDLADRVGVAASTCHARVAALRARGVLRGFHADVSPEALGRGLQAIIAVRLQAAARARLGAFARGLAERPEVRDVYLLGGAEDVLVHVAVQDSPALRAFVVEHLSTRHEVAHTQTSLVFEHLHAPTATR
ncbi:Lrp/AsnC family transcriptional regulator [Cellulomonas sp. SLBN-39]|uniref:Lrp/AsnC family transcriptional regulator n=1 Tax=Cellulomonas sp. SLBN-39 TaxID=2768446 RepID=UPI00114F2EF1|nr:Lrp/AsnC family transcriptional regulator [Cellulomonas sp. SLBN-39]TQL03996.1 DNA-binding Lrp family transcriptional regulator [Cellulomonas sp. SLBN-39]